MTTDTEPIPTHVGWFLLCPIYARDLDEIPWVWARYSWLEPLLSLMHYVQAGFITVASLMFPEREFGWMLFLRPIEDEVTDDHSV